MGSIMQVINRAGSLSLEPIVTTGDKTPAGLISAFAGITPPSGWLLCDGSELLIADYPDLYACIGDLYGTASDADHFLLPDYREVVLRGAGQSANDYNATTNPNGIHTHNALALGEFQDDALQQNQASQFGSTNSTRDRTATGAFGVTTLGDSASGGQGSGFQGVRLTFDLSRIARTSSTTHDKSIGVNYIIKY